MKNLLIFGNKVLVEIITKKEDTIFIIPGNDKDKPDEGKVVSIGDGKVDDKTISMNVKMNDIVYFFVWNSQKVKFNNKQYYLVKYTDLIGKEEI